MIRGGGAARVMVQLANRFSRLGYDIIFITNQKLEGEYSLDSSIKRVSLDTCLKEKNGLVKNFKIIYNLRKICRESNSNVLITFMREPNVRGILATLGIKTKSIISVRNDPLREYPGFLGRFISRYILVLSNGCVFQTRDAQNWATEKLKSNSIVIKNAVDEKFFKVDRCSTPKNIVTIGRLTEQKNQKLLIDVYEKFQKDNTDDNLLIYGEGDLKEKLEEYVSKKGISKSVFFEGQTDAVTDVLSEAKVFVLSSDYEGMPNVLMEALAMGVPSISTNCPCGGPKDLIDNDDNGILVPVRGEREMLNALKKITSNNEFAQKLSNNAKKESNNFHPEIIFKEWKDYIESILDL